MRVGAVASALAVAGVVVAAVLFPLALFAIVPVALGALGFFGFACKRHAHGLDEAKAGAKAGAQEPMLPSTWQPEPLAVLHDDDSDEVKDTAARALHYLRRLQQPGVFTPDAIVGALAHARGCNARMWIRASHSMWASLDGDGYYFAVPNAQRTVNLVNDDTNFRGDLKKAGDDAGDDAQSDSDDKQTAMDGAHYQSLRLADGVAPSMNREFDWATATYTLPADAVTEVPARAGGDCLFHAWAAAEDCDGYGGLDKKDKAGRQARVNALREMTVASARRLIEEGDETLRKDLALAADHEVLFNWRHGTEELAAARHWEGDPDAMRAVLKSAQTFLFAVNGLLAPYQRAARREVMAKLRETWQLERRLPPPQG